MAEALDRDTMIHLLNRLGSGNDDDVLEAARYLDGRIKEAGMSWDDLLVPSFEETAPPAEQPVVSAPRQAPAGAVETNDDALGVIDTLLARSDISADLREELEGYKSDIADGDLDESDRRYLASLYDRLS